MFKNEFIPVLYLFKILLADIEKTNWGILTKKARWVCEIPLRVYLYFMLVYKYRGGNENTFQRDLQALDESYIWASAFKDLNDPCEAITNKIGFKKQYRGFAHLLGIRSKEFDNLLDENADDILAYNQIKGVYSLSETHRNELLWAHYAKGHKGFCIAYDLEELLLGIGADVVLSLPVKYTDRPPKISFIDLIFGGEKRWIEKVSLYKSKHWTYEREHRIITNSPGKHYYKQHAVKALYFGLQMSKEHRATVLKTLVGREIDYYQVVKPDNSYGFGVKPFNFNS